MSTDKVLKELGIKCVDEVVRVGVVVEGSDEDAVVACRPFDGHLGDDEHGRPFGDLDPAGALAPTDGGVRLVRRRLPGVVWHDALESLGEEDGLAVIMSVVALDVRAALVCGVVYL